MKKINLFLALGALFLMGTSLKAQSTPELGIRGGASLANFGGSKLKNLNEKDAKFGFLGGITLDLPLAENLYIQSGLDFVTKGAKYKSNSSIASASAKFNPMYLQLPIHIAYKIPVTMQTKIVLGVGPYIAYGLGGKIKTEGSVLGLSGSSEYDFFGKNGLAKRFDVGAGINAGVEFGKIAITLGYDLGFMNILDKSDDKIQANFDKDSPSLRNQSAFLALGLKF